MNIHPVNALRRWAARRPAESGRFGVRRGRDDATTEAVVWSSVAILVLDYFLNSVLL